MRSEPYSLFKQPISFPRRISASGVCDFASPPRIEGWSAEKRSGEHPCGVSCASKTRVNALMTRYARRLRGALRPITRDARLSALHRGFALFRSFPPPLSRGRTERGLRHASLRIQDRL